MLVESLIDSLKLFSIVDFVDNFKLVELHFETLKEENTINELNDCKMVI